MKMSEIRGWAENLPAITLLDYLEKNDLNGYLKAIDAMREIIDQRMYDEMIGVVSTIQTFQEREQTFDLDAG